nr:hypothetical protein [Rhizoctonia sp.]
MRNQYLTKVQREQFTLSETLKEILVGLYLGDISSVKKSDNYNSYLYFEQGLVHKDYIFHLYDLFQNYCLSAPKISKRLPDKRTGNIYTRVRFTTCSLPCFNELHNLFYQEGKKIVPSNIAELLTPLSLTYWICDDGSFCKRDRVVRLCTHSFSLEEVNLLINVLEVKWNLKCTINKHYGSFMIRISAKSLPELQSLLKDIMPSMMKYKIGL